MSDGFQMSDSILFLQNLNEKVKTLQECSYAITNVLEYNNLGNRFVVIADFKYVRLFDDVVGAP